METQVIQVKKIAGALGAEIQGIDLREPITDEIFTILHDALIEHQVIFFRNQNITPAQHKALAQRFGKLQTHPAYPHVKDYPEISILENTKENPSKIELWHHDMTFKLNPPLGSILLARHVPEAGGDTLFSSMSAAYEALSDKWQHFLSGLTAVHDFAHGFKESLAEPGGRERLKQALIDNPPVEHPVIRTHPVSGKKGIFVNELFTRNIAGMKERESRAILQFLFEHVTTPEFTCRFKWEPDSIAFWDNRITQHKPVNDYFPQYRCMHRIVIEGDRPR
ncbi:MAG: alpha-ketoglutarate-dependent taurine dioxygenase [Chitinophagales bacterium]|nr:MAG: alpha-ketoglutarate-dependent taurine dioxygenase [Chitinophagales bacterium]